jgi:3-hydroxybutyryl-CoA dehydrogenase
MIGTIAVIGAGQMGRGIAQVFGRHGYAVILNDRDDAQLTKAHSSIAEGLERLASKGSLERGQVCGIMERIRTSASLSDLASAEFVIEAVTENIPLKLDLFRKLDDSLPQGVILASNTSSISITRIAAETRRPDRVIGMHFMNPVPVMRLVEVIRGLATSQETFAITSALVASLGKEMAVARDYPGFIVNRILVPMINEAIFSLFEGIATAEDIDKGMKLGTNQPMGPLALADLIGLDTLLAISEVLYDGFKDPKYRPCPLLVNMVNAGYLGRKSGQGFYRY